MNDPLFLSLPRAGKVIGVGKDALRRLVVSGDLPVVVVGRRRYVLREGLEEWARSNLGREIGQEP
jgi:excisionase family DNA binding protein